jgi:hypothetical protein
MVNYKYKYLKYKHKYLELLQKGGEILNTLSKKDFSEIYFINFKYAAEIDFIPSEFIIDDSLAIELINDYDDYIEDLDEEQMQENSSDEATEIQNGGNKIKKTKSKNKQIKEKNTEEENTEQENTEQENTEQENTEGEITEEENTDEQNLNYEYPEDEEDNPIDILEEIDIENWKPSSTQENQYFAIKINNDDKNYLLKIVNANFKYEFKKNMEDYDDEYGKLMKMKNILAPIYLFKDEENCICGYLFEIKDYVNLNNYFSDNNDLNENDFLEIIKGICKCFINILNCNLKPCADKNKVMIKDDKNISILLTETDQLLKCKHDIEEETVRSIVKLIDVEKIPREIKNSYSFSKIFNYSDYGLTLQNNIVSVKGLYNLIDKLQK